MADYTPVTDFSAKDALTSGDPEKVILGADVDVEFDAIATAIATKFESADIATQAEAEAGTNNVALMTPLRTEEHATFWAAENAGIVFDLHELVDPNADQLFGWDDSADATIGFTLVAGELEFVGTEIGTGSNVPLLSGTNTFTGLNIIENTNARLDMRETDGALNAKNWITRVQGGVYSLETRDDSLLGPVTALAITRSGTAITEIELNATTLDFNGAMDVSGMSTFTSSLSAAQAGIVLSSGTPGWILDETDQDADWRFYSLAGNLTFDLRLNDGSAFGTWAQVFRTGATIDEIELNATTLDFNGNADISGSVTVNGNGFTHSAAFPVYRLVETDAPLDEKNSGFYSIAGELRFFVQNDSSAGEVLWMQVHRAGTTIATIELNATTLELNATTLDLNGNLDVSGTALWGGGAAIASSDDVVQFADIGGNQIYAGSVSAAGAFESLSGNASGWTVANPTTGAFVVTHNLGVADAQDLVVTVSSKSGAAIATVASETVNTFNVAVFEPGGVAADEPFSFTVVDVS